MKAKPEEQKALIQLMDRQYGEIRAIEVDWQIFGAEGDYRPRIEYYHDAVRALSNGETAENKNSRLSAERLAYDVSMLRHIHAKPTTAGRGQQHFSTSDAVAGPGQPSHAVDPDREVRAELKKLYKDYTVLFVALLAEKADRNAETRTDEANMLAGDCALLQEMLQKLARGEVGMAEVLAAVDQIEHDQLRRAVRQMLTARKVDKKEIGEALQTLGNAKRGADAEIKKIDQAMLSFSGSQLAVYEESREVVKGLAAKGMNIAGKFVENAMKQAQGQGRGL